MATVTYNGLTLPFQHGKISFDQSGNRLIRFSTNFGVATTSLITTIETLKQPDKDLVIFGETYSVTGKATRITTTVTKSGRPEDGSGRKYLTLTVEVGLKDDQSGNDGLSDWTSDLTVDEQGRKTITVSGEWTGTAGGDSAKTNYDQGIAALESTVRTLYGGGVFNPARRDITDHDKFDNSLSFESTMVEALETANVYDGSESYEAGIIFSRWDMGRARELVRGHNDAPAEYVTVSFECLFDRSYANPRDALVGKIQALVIKRIQDQLGGTGVVLEREDERISTTEMNARATWTYRLDKGAQYLVFDETITDVTNYGGVTKVTDGRPYTMTTWSPGATLIIEQSVTAEYVGGIPGDPVPPLVAGIPGVVLIPLDRSRGRGNTDVGETGDGVSPYQPLKETRRALNYVKKWAVVVPSSDDPRKSEVVPAQPG